MTCEDWMVNTRQYTPEFSGLAFDEAVQRAVNALLPGLTTQITNWLPIRNGAWGIDAEKLGDRFTIRSCSRFWGVLMSSRLGSVWMHPSLAAFSFPAAGAKREAGI
ncbi:hypothetical protein Tco_1578764 [Tanacetum coccineum]